MSFSDHIIFVDESGDHSISSIDPQYPVFALAFCILRIGDYVRHLVGRLSWDVAFCWHLWSGQMERLAGACSGAADAMGLLLRAAPSPLPAFAVPDKRRRLRIPAPRRLLEPAADRRRAVGMLPGERAALEHALDRLRHVEPAAAHGRVQGHDALREQPQHQFGCLVTGKIVPHQQKPQRRQVLWQSEAHRQARLPDLPRRMRGRWITGSGHRQLRKDRCEALAQPWMQHRVGAPLGRLEPHLA